MQTAFTNTQTEFERHALVVSVRAEFKAVDEDTRTRHRLI